MPSWAPDASLQQQPVADKNVWSIQKYFIAEKLKSVFTLVIEYSGKLGLTRVLLNISIDEFRETISWSNGRKVDAFRKKEKNSLDM